MSIEELISMVMGRRCSDGQARVTQVDGLQVDSGISKGKNLDVINRREPKGAGWAQLNDVHTCLSLGKEAKSHRQEVIGRLARS